MITKSYDLKDFFRHVTDNDDHLLKFDTVYEHNINV